eukprot:CAMPEP_0197890260 /NCGR_PEP_ID=MMETSP1439-20131203/26013_1 /TAXON_ID=66791 /ORGANISM="Gonyaulax spinifera, Strain CCMP409" /LENGTH=41 /DNA_ID= /DNA_START= /DNA_END= /DNA_ORIENTATION=
MNERHQERRPAQSADDRPAHTTGDDSQVHVCREKTGLRHMA